MYYYNDKTCVYKFKIGDRVKILSNWGLERQVDLDEIYTINELSPKPSEWPIFFIKNCKIIVHPTNLKLI